VSAGAVILFRLERETIAVTPTEVLVAAPPEDGVAVIVAVDGPVSSGTCVVDGDWVSVNLTAGTVGGTECDALSFAEGLSAPYEEIRHQYGSLAEGTYELTVSGSAMTVDSSNYNGSGSPQTSPAIYSATVAITYRTADLTYETTTRVAPGEPDD
jgi:hypothetical protein